MIRLLPGPSRAISNALRVASSLIAFFDGLVDVQISCLPSCAARHSDAGRWQTLEGDDQSRGVQGVFLVVARTDVGHIARCSQEWISTGLVSRVQHPHCVGRSHSTTHSASTDSHGLTTCVVGVNAVVTRACVDLCIASTRSTDSVVTSTTVDGDVVVQVLVVSPVLQTTAIVSATDHGQSDCVVTSTAINAECEVRLTSHHIATATGSVAVDSHNHGVVVSTALVVKVSAEALDVVGSDVSTRSSCSNVNRVDVLADSVRGDSGCESQLASHGRTVDQANIGETSCTSTAVVDNSRTSNTCSVCSTGAWQWSIESSGSADNAIHSQITSVFGCGDIGSAGACCQTVLDHHFTQGVVGGVDGLQLAVVAHFNVETLNAHRCRSVANGHAANNQIATSGTHTHVIQDDVGVDQSHRGGRASVQGLGNSANAWRNTASQPTCFASSAGSHGARGAHCQCQNLTSQVQEAAGRWSGLWISCSGCSQVHISRQSHSHATRQVLCSAASNDLGNRIDSATNASCLQCGHECGLQLGVISSGSEQRIFQHDQLLDAAGSSVERVTTHVDVLQMAL